MIHTLTGADLENALTQRREIDLASHGRNRVTYDAVTAAYRIYSDDGEVGTTPIAAHAANAYNELERRSS